MVEKRGLGRGLSALMADIDTTPSEGAHLQRQRGTLFVAIEKLLANPDQPRRQFLKDDLEDLTRSIKEKGIIQPLIVRPNPSTAGTYQIVAGERRWRAAQAVPLHEVPVVVRNLDDTEVLEFAIIENIQRTDLNPVEEAAGYQQLMRRFGHTQEQLSSALGKSRSHIANLLRLLSLPEQILTHLKEGRLTTGHARALITADSPLALAQQIIARGLSVRQTEKLVKEGPIKKSQRAPRATKKDTDTVSLENDLSANLKMKVRIDHKPGSTKGNLSISYQDFEELDTICRLLSATRSAGTSYS